MLKKTIIFAVAVAFLGAGIPATTASAATPTKYFSSCAKLSKKYPAGVAKNSRAANRAVRQGFSRPSTSKAAKSAYWDNYTRLDRDRDGVACES